MLRAQARQYRVAVAYWLQAAGVTGGQTMLCIFSWISVELSLENQSYKPKMQQLPVFIIRLTFFMHASSRRRVVMFSSTNAGCLLIEFRSTVCKNLNKTTNKRTLREVLCKFRFVWSHSYFFKPLGCVACLCFLFDWELLHLSLPHGIFPNTWICAAAGDQRCHYQKKFFSTVSAASNTPVSHTQKAGNPVPSSLRFRHWLPCLPCLFEQTSKWFMHIVVLLIRRRHQTTLIEGFMFTV
jgi:hypothetical protein